MASVPRAKAAAAEADKDNIIRVQQRPRKNRMGYDAFKKEQDGHKDQKKSDTRR